MKKIKKTIIVLVIILIIVALIIVYTIMRLKKNSNIQNSDNDEGKSYYFDILENNPSELINGEKMDEVKSENIYFTIDKIINKYYEYLEEANSEAIYSILYKEYINENGLNEQNVLININKCSNYKINEMYSLGTTGYEIYHTEISNNEKDERLLINLDRNSNTFSICPISEEEYKKGIEKGLEVDAQRITSIEANDFNKVTYQNLDKDNIARRYFQDFIGKIVNNPEEAFTIMDEKYKKVSFASYEDFKEYIDNNKQRFETLDRSNIKEAKDFSSEEEYEKYITEKTKYHLQEYSKKYKDNMTEYTFKDSYGKYYTFKVTAAMKYTVLLDNYTLPTDDFLNTYNKSTAPQKVVLNVKKFFMGIDDKNYGYSYSLLSDSFKSNKYPTKNDFISYVKQNFFEQNEIEYVNYEEQNGVYIYKINITDATGKSQEKKSFNIIVKLNSGTDFEMSFGAN